MESKSYVVMSNFMQLLETIANGKINVLNFGEGMVFYRGEIHTIKVIGDQPGMFLSEIARCFHVTRAVVSKIVLKLERNGYVRKMTDPVDKKRVRVYLTERGQAAFQAHNHFHCANDGHIYEYLSGLTEAELEVIAGFLQKARQMVDHHF
jgi:DNA-binding MarR family transcriptional regulator